MYTWKNHNKWSHHASPHQVRTHPTFLERTEGRSTSWSNMHTWKNHIINEAIMLLLPIRLGRTQPSSNAPRGVVTCWQAVLHISHKLTFKRFRNNCDFSINLWSDDFERSTTRWLMKYELDPGLDVILDFIESRKNQTTQQTNSESWCLTNILYRGD